MESPVPNRRLTFGRSASRTVTPPLPVPNVSAVLVAGNDGYVGGRGPGSRNFVASFGTPGSAASNLQTASGVSGEVVSFCASAGAAAASSDSVTRGRRVIGSAVRGWGGSIDCNQHPGGRQPTNGFVGRIH